VVAQTAIALVLTIGAALLAHSVIRLSHVDPGFDPRDVVWLEVTLPAHTYPTPASRMAFFDTLLERVRASNGVVAAGGIVGRPLGGGNAVSSVFPEGELPARGAAAPRVPYHSVTPGYFSALRIPVIDGRDFDTTDDQSAPRSAIVSRAFAQRFWSGERAIGKRFWMGRVAADAPLTTVVGVVEDVRQYGLDSVPVPMVYRSLAQVPGRSLGIVVRHDGRAPATSLQSLRDVAWTIDAGLPLDEFGTMDAHVRASISEPRFRATTLSVVSAIATALAFVGLFSTLSWVVRARRRELGIRMALGADARSVQRLVIVRGLQLAAAGVTLGTIAAVLASQSLSSMVFGITTTDPATFATAIGAMTFVALVASWLPARVAARTDPAATLRAE
jgi:predicted permease